MANGISITDATTGEAISGTSIPVATKRPNAFAEIMSKKPRLVNTPPVAKANTFFAGRDGLGAYIHKPESFGTERVITHNDNYVLIHDLYPKASVHTLVLPRDPIVSLQHPFDAFSDPTFLAETKAEVANAVKLVASELRHKFGRHSAKEQALHAAKEKVGKLPSQPPEEKCKEQPEQRYESHLDGAPEGRNWAEEVKVGVHAHPSMNHLHVHVMSRDMMSPCMKHRKHYQTFNTPFFVPLEAFPLAEDDERRHPGRAGYIEEELVCWRCGEGFGNKFAKLKSHLAWEFDRWKQV